MEEQSVHKNFVFQITTMVIAGLILSYVIPPKKDFHIPQANLGDTNYSGIGQKGSRERTPANALSLEEKPEKLRLKNQTIIDRGLQVIRSTPSK